MKKILLLLWCCVIVLPSLSADPVSGSRFLLLGVGGRAVGMGGAFTGLADDVSAGHWNPAGLAQADRVQVLSMYDRWFEDTSHFYATAGFPLGKNGALAAQVNSLTTGDIPLVDDGGALAGTFSAGDTALAVSYARGAGKRLSLGASVRVIHETLEKESGTGIGIDLGSLYRLSERLGIGLAVQNIGQGIKHINETSLLPLAIKAGFGYRAAGSKTNELNIAADLAMLPIDRSVTAGIGGEFVLSRLIALRSGVKIGRSVVPAFGLGLKINDISLDWATELFGELGSPNIISLSMQFGKGRKK